MAAAGGGVGTTSGPGVGISGGTGGIGGGTGVATTGFEVVVKGTLLL